MMKKSFLTKSIIAAGVVSSLTAANASGLGDLKFYAGAGLDYNMYSFDSDAKAEYDELKSSGFGFAVPVLGVKFHENFGIEAGYSFNKKIKYTAKAVAAHGVVPAQAAFASSVRVRNMYLDLVGFMPIAEQFDLLGGLGIGRISAKDRADGSSDSKTSWRAKIGAQYNVISNMAIRAIFSYQKAGKNKSLLKNVKNIGLYGIYTF